MDFIYFNKHNIESGTGSETRVRVDLGKRETSRRDFIVRVFLLHFFSALSFFFLNTASLTTSRFDTVRCLNFQISQESGKLNLRYRATPATIP